MLIWTKRCHPSRHTAEIRKFLAAKHKVKCNINILSLHSSFAGLRSIKIAMTGVNTRLIIVLGVAFSCQVALSGQDIGAKACNDIKALSQSIKEHPTDAIALSMIAGMAKGGLAKELIVKSASSLRGDLFRLAKALSENVGWIQANVRGNLVLMNDVVTYNGDLLRADSYYVDRLVNSYTKYVKSVGFRTKLQLKANSKNLADLFKEYLLTVPKEEIKQIVQAEVEAAISGVAGDPKPLTNLYNKVGALYGEKFWEKIIQRVLERGVEKKLVEIRPVVAPKGSLPIKLLGGAVGAIVLDMVFTTTESGSKAHAQTVEDRYIEYPSTMWASPQDICNLVSRPGSRELAQFIVKLRELQRESIAYAELEENLGRVEFEKPYDTRTCH